MNAEHELTLLTASDGPRSTARDLKRDVAGMRGALEGLADSCAEQRTELAAMREHLYGRNETMREQLIADVQAELLQGRGGLRQVVERQVLGMDIQVDLDAVRAAAQEWNVEFQAETESRVHAAMDAAQAMLANAAMVAVADAHALQRSSTGLAGNNASLRGIDTRLSKIEKQWSEERRVILRKLQALDAENKEAAATAAQAASAAAAAVARAIVEERTPSPLLLPEGQPPQDDKEEELRTAAIAAMAETSHGGGSSGGGQKTAQAAAASDGRPESPTSRLDMLDEVMSEVRKEGAFLQVKEDAPIFLRCHLYYKRSYSPGTSTGKAL